jgi:hypothetical protein
MRLAIPRLAFHAALAPFFAGCGTAATPLSESTRPDAGGPARALGEATDGGTSDAMIPGAGAFWSESGATSPAPDAGAGVIDGAPTTTQEAATGDGGMPPQWARVYGVTVDDISDVSGIVASLGALPHKPTTRIVFDQAQQASYYANAVSAVHAVSFVMGEILDSAFVKDVSVADYAKRTSAYLAALSTDVDIWEVGNEINGNWLDTTAGGVADVVAKMTGAFDLVRAAGGRTALTLYGCSDSDPAHDMFQWANANVPSRMISGLDYVLVSYYEGDCTAPRSDWAAVFHELRQMFPTAGIGFGETGAVDSSGQNLADVSVETPYLQRYYGMQIAEPGYVGGYFWWYFYEDMVPSTKPLFRVLSDAIR